ncbi:S-layer homology domain-containing protein [Paenibacillus beijingensis]|uniref:SLH domain-containing protein n=1 Tax=Paenibacillus beijingensis TaxID=1126833 RepID=A0A0D5NGC4_9BACL|nr:S-layer homology domain-containing protein [Paenibacillus beijingensis]AJY73968.1 hypothetical protein VN24_04250 [Paenibacillus beijingensis]
MKGKLKKKVAVSALSLTVAASSFGGVPLSVLGIPSLDAGVANAADIPALKSQTLERLNKIRAALLAGDPVDVQDVRNLKSEIAALRGTEILELFRPVWDKITDDVPETADRLKFRENAASLFRTIMALPYDTTGANLEEVRTHDDYKYVVKVLRESARSESLSVDDVIFFLIGDGGSLKGVQGTIIDTLSQKSIEELVGLLLDRSKLNDVIFESIKKVLDDNQYELSKVLTTLGVTPKDINDSIINTQIKLKYDVPAGSALAIALFRAESVLKAVESDSGRTKTLKLEFFGKEVPPVILKWSKVSGGSNVTVKDDGIVTIPSTDTTGTAEIKATFTDPRTDAVKTVFQGPVTLTFKSDNTGGGNNGGGNNGGGSSSESGLGTQEEDPFDKVVAAALAEFRATIAVIKPKLATATGDQKELLIRDAVKAGQKAYDTIAPYDVSKLAKVTDSVYAPVLDTVYLTSRLGKIGNASKIIKGVLTEEIKASKFMTGTYLKVPIVFDVGTATTAKSAVELPAAIVQTAKANGLTFVGAKSSGTSLLLPLSRFSGPVKLQLTKLDNKTVTSLTYDALASDVYDFEITVGGNKVTTFTDPVILNLPLVNASKLNKELLTVIKIDGTTIDYQIGFVKGEFVIESRDTLSSYAVVEHKVTFTDLAPVQAWAGNPITVIASKGIASGRTADKFVPKGIVTRAEFTKMLVRAFNLEVAGATEKFVDVNSTDWFAPYVAAAVKHGITYGRDFTHFEPKATITRAEMVTMMTRALKLAGGYENATDIAGALKGFKDAKSISSALQGGVAFASSHGLVMGSGGKFYPNANATRAEAAVLIYRGLDLLKK